MKRSLTIVDNLQNSTKRRKSTTMTTGPGNTSSGPSRSKHWTFTWNNYPTTWIDTIKFSGASKYVCQPEIGENGTKHIQGILTFENQRTFDSVKKLLPTCHLEKVKSLKHCIEYCSIAQTRSGDTIVHGYNVKPVIKDPITNPYDWQKKILDLTSKEPHPRQIIWITDSSGAKGKTALCKHICLTNNSAIVVGGKQGDAKYAIAKMVSENRHPSIVLFNFCRTQEGYISYEAIEAIKDGIFFSSKYESGMVIYNTPHVICMSNWDPDESKLSQDRWNIINLDEFQVPGACRPLDPAQVFDFES